MITAEAAHLRLEHLYEISKLFASFETVHQTVDRALVIVARTLPIRSAILLETTDLRARMIVWPSDGQTSEQVRAVKQHVAEAYAYLSGASSVEALGLVEQPGATLLPAPARAQGETFSANRFIVIPMVVFRRRPFGALQLEGAAPFDNADLMFVNAVANQLAIAIDRHRSWRRDITRREDAEERQTHAEAKGATADLDRIDAESASEKYEALAAENARLLKEAKHAVNVREQVLAVVSHDLKNPLGAIQMTAAVLAKRTVSEERRQGLPQAIARIQRASARMLRLIEDLLDFASIEAGRLSIRRCPNDASSIVQEVLVNFEASAQEKGLRLVADVQSSLPNVYCDRDRLLQVFTNLVGNAIKATAGGGEIVLRVEGGGHEILFRVSDNGLGIAEEDVKHLFERYWRGDEPGYKGTGLGLAIAQGIINAHGGGMWAESVLGQGATFHFTIPIADETSLFAVPVPDETPHFPVSGG